MRLFPSKLRSRLMVLVGLVIMPVVVLIAINSLLERETLLSDAKHEAMHMVTSTTQQVNNLALETQTMLSLLGRMPQVNSPEYGDCNTLFASLQKQATFYANIGLIRPDGSVACSALPHSDDIHLEDRSYFRRAIATGTFVAGDFETSRITHHQSINFAYPLLDGWKRVQGVLFAAVSLQWIHHNMANSDLPEETTISLIDPSGQLLRISGQLEGEQLEMAGAALMQAIPSSGSQEFTHMNDPDGTSRLFVFESVPGLPKDETVHIAIGLPISAIYARADEHVIRNFAILTVVAAIVLLIAWRGSNLFILRQIGYLLTATRELAAGNSGTRAITIPNGGELAELAIAFNNMAETIEQHTMGLDRLNRIYAILSSINGTILRVRDRQALLEEACRIAVEHGRFRMAWIGMVDETKQFLQPIAHSGASEELVRGRYILLQEENEADGISLAARATGVQEMIVIDDMDENAALSAWKRETANGEFHSMVVLPLTVEEETVGTFSLYADEVGLFDQKELMLLKELASDTSLGLEIIDKSDRLYDLVHFDPLTELPNLHEFERRVSQTIAQAQREGKKVAVLAIGIDHLHRIRDSLGRHAGDEALRRVAGHLKSVAGTESSLGRIGRDEFGMILTEIESSAQVAEIAETLFKDFPRILSIQEDEFFLNFNIGATLYPQDGVGTIQLTRNAELAMHHAPVADMEEPLVFFSSKMEEQIHWQRRIEQQLRRAIERNEFELHYQPVVDIHSRMMIGAEALLRWNSNELGHVSPADFIPIAEASNLIVPIGEWAMTQAFKQAAEWKRHGLPDIRTVVNISMKQLLQPDFAERVGEIRRFVAGDKSDLPLGIEVTESQLMSSADQALEALSRLKAMGFAVYIDDFGTGYSSLSYLRQLPADILKIDISFVRDIEHLADAVTMAKGIIALAHSLDLRVVAEGVETPGQLALLENMHCDYVQGYLFGRPDLPGKVERMIGKMLPDSNPSHHI